MALLRTTDSCIELASYKSGVREFALQHKFHTNPKAKHWPDETDTGNSWNRVCKPAARGQATCLQLPRVTVPATSMGKTDQPLAAQVPHEWVISMGNASQYSINSDAVRIVKFLTANGNTIIKKHEGAVHDAQSETMLKTLS